jgi:ABC-2 type transport system permease protein
MKHCRNLTLRVAWRELYAISHSLPVLLVLVGGVFLYGLLYNYMYAPNVVHEVPIAVVDHSQSALSRQYIRWMDATPGVQVAHRTQQMPEAKRLMQQAEVYGILYLPRDLTQRLYDGRPAVYPMYASTDAFLYYETIEKANLEVMEAIDGVYRMSLIATQPLPSLVAAATQSPVTVVGTALYNPTEGYGTYLIPSVLMIIIFQTLMLLVAMMAGDEHRLRLLRPYSRLRCTSLHAALSLVCGKSLTYVVLYALFALFLLGILPPVFALPHRASVWSLAVLLVPYLCSTSFLGLALSRWYTDAEAPVLLITFFSIGLIFLSGVSYPFELMPWYWQCAHYLIPAAPAVLAFIELNSMGATLQDVAPSIVALVLQSLVYFICAVMVYRRKLALFSRPSFG